MQLHISCNIFKQGVFVLFSVTIAGADSFKDLLAKLPQVLHESADQVCVAAAQMVVDRAKEIVPVRTGKLQRSLTVIHPETNVCIVESDVLYAPFIEVGTSRMRAQPFLRPALAEVELRLTVLWRQMLLQELYEW